MGDQVWAAMAGMLVTLAIAGGCTSAGSGGIVEQALPGAGACAFEDAILSFRLAGEEGLIGVDGFECRAVYGLRPHPDGTAETWILGGVQDGAPTWFRSAGGGWQEIRFGGPLPGEPCRPHDVVAPERLYAHHATAVDRIFAESDHPPVLTLTSGRWELAGARGRERLGIAWDAYTGERIDP
ncbi:MAG: hypothetical protein ACP5C4_08790 [Methanomicrobiales archaeon]